MHPIHFLALCLLSVTAFADSDNASSTADTDPDSYTLVTESYGSCFDDRDCTGLSFCDNATFSCRECRGCCSHKGDDCPRPRCHCSLFLTDEELKIVAQAVLGVAIFVTCVALLSLLWKICVRRLRQRRAAALGANLLDDTVSLSSQQVFVVERLRDRPPRYEEAARDIAIEKPPPYAEIAFTGWSCFPPIRALNVTPELFAVAKLPQQPVGEVEVERPPQTVMVGGVPVTLVVGGLTARDFMAPPPYSPPTTRTEPASSLVPPPVPRTPPVQRLRRCVRKVVMISRLGRNPVTAPETECGSRPPKVVSPRQCETLRTQPGLSGAADLAATASTSEPSAVATGFPQSEVAAALPVGRGAAGEEFGPVPDSPTSTVA